MELDIGELPLVGGHPALDLVNTLARGPASAGEVPHDYLVDAAALLAWSRRAGLLDGAEAKAVAAALDVLRTADPPRLRRCPPEDGGCGWVFLDHSRNGLRRWCRMADCGTRVKARRLTERRRAARSTP